MLLPSLVSPCWHGPQVLCGLGFHQSYVWASVGCASGEVTGDSRLPLLQCTLEAQHRQAKVQTSTSSEGVSAWPFLWWHWLCPSQMQAQDVYTGAVISGLRPETTFTVIINPSGVVMWYLYPIKKPGISQQ